MVRFGVLKNALKNRTEPNLTIPTAKRNRISPILMEALQMLKYSLKKERLNFMNGWSISEAAMSMSVPTGELGSLFVDDPVVSFDNLLNDLINYDDCES
ncbi:hypothetical protein F5888DRAFT_1616583 [Russula emetica]|nr:hypothetical protein F5888DRAFT_1616583 [Russula emetica]